MATSLGETVTLAVGQFGAPTSVINSSLFGFVEGAQECRLLGIVGGPEGLHRGDLRPLVRTGGASGGPETLEIGPSSSRLPGALLGAGRYPLYEADLEGIVRSLDEMGVSGIALIGGNGTMFLADALQRRAATVGSALCTVGIPKTRDNDLFGTDHSPGFLSAARFLISAVEDLDLDLEAMRSIEQVRIVEALGRNTGWLALSTLGARRSTGGAPHLVYVPERDFDEDAFLDDVAEAIRQNGRALVVVAEGIGNALERPFDRPDYEHPQSGGIARHLAELVVHRLGVGARSEVLGLIQRCASGQVCPLDRVEAYALGHAGARRLRAGARGVMVGLAERRPGDPPASDSFVEIPLGEVGGRTRAIPASWLPDDSAGDAEEFLAWLVPLLSGDEAPESGTERRAPGRTRSWGR